jgi:hypothetical protein
MEDCRIVLIAGLFLPAAHAMVEIAAAFSQAAGGDTPGGT